MAVIIRKGKEVKTEDLRAKRATPELKKMRLLPGKKHLHDGVTLEAGDVVELTPSQQKAFADKFVPVDADPKDDAAKAKATEVPKREGAAPGATAKLQDGGGKQ